MWIDYAYIAMYKGNSCLAWHFLTIATATGDAFAHECVALEVGFRSTLVPTLQHACVLPNANARILLPCKEGFMQMHLVNG